MEIEQEIDLVGQRRVDFPHISVPGQQFQLAGGAAYRVGEIQYPEWFFRFRGVANRVAGIRSRLYILRQQYRFPDPFLYDLLDFFPGIIVIARGAPQRDDDDSGHQIAEFGHIILF